MDQRLADLRRYFRGWAGYFALVVQLKLFDHFDQWIRRRLRMCFWKCWRFRRFVRTRIRNLLALGVHADKPSDTERVAKAPGTWPKPSPAASG